MQDDSQDFANFAKGDDDVIKSIAAPVSVGQLDALSDGDILNIRLLYQCQSGPRALSDYKANPCTEDCPGNS